jgi:hypothetical protein
VCVCVCVRVENRNDNSDTGLYKGLKHEDIGGNKMHVTRYVKPYDFYIRYVS